MTTAEISELCHFTVHGPRQRVDLTVPTGIPLLDLLADLVALVADDPSVAAADGGAWVLQRLGETPLDPALTVAEAGLPGYDISGWFGMLAPAGVSKEIIGQINAAVTRAVRLPEMNEVFSRQGLEAQGTTPEQFGEFIRKELAKSAMLIKTIGLKPE